MLVGVVKLRSRAIQHRASSDLSCEPESGHVRLGWSWSPPPEVGDERHVHAPEKGCVLNSTRGGRADLRRLRKLVASASLLSEAPRRAEAPRPEGPPRRQPTRTAPANLLVDAEVAEGRHRPRPGRRPEGPAIPRVRAHLAGDSRSPKAWAKPNVASQHADNADTRPGPLPTAR